MSIVEKPYFSCDFQKKCVFTVVLLKMLPHQWIHIQSAISKGVRKRKMYYKLRGKPSLLPTWYQLVIRKSRLYLKKIDFFGKKNCFLLYQSLQINTPCNIVQATSKGNSTTPLQTIFDGLCSFWSHFQGQRMDTFLKMTL